MVPKSSKHWPSVVDVLLNDASRLSVKKFADDSAMVEEQVRQHLVHLLNTRRKPISLSENLVEANSSLLTFGIPDFSCNGFDSHKQRRWLCLKIEESINYFEPRLLKVKVKDQNNSENLDRILRFEIAGTLQVYPHAHRVVFDSRLDRFTSLFWVERS